MSSPGHAQLGAAASRPGFPAGLRVLVVGDDVAQLRSSLESYQYCVTTASSCDAASQELASGKAFDVVMCESSLVEPQPPSKLASPAAAAFCASAKHLPLILLADPGAPARRAVWIGLDLGAAEVIEKPPAESKLRTIWQHAVRRACPPVASSAALPPSSSAAAMRRRSISGALGGGGCSSASLNNGNGLMPSGDNTSRDSLDSGLAGGANLHATATSSARAAAAQAAAAQARAAAATAARSAAVCRRANSMGSRPAPRKFVVRSASAARIGSGGGSRGSLDASVSAAALHRAAVSDQHLERLLSSDALSMSIAASMSAPQPLPPPPMVLIPLGPGEEACDADDAATSAVAAAMTSGLDITRSLTPPAQIIGASNQNGGEDGASTPPGCVWGTPLLASTAADAAAAAASTAAAAAGAPRAVPQPAAAAAPSYRHYPSTAAAVAAAAAAANAAAANNNNNGGGGGVDDCCLAPPPITSFEDSSMLTAGGTGSGGLSPAESGGNGSGGSGSGGSGLYHEPPSSLRSPSSAFDVCYAGVGDDVRSRGHGESGQQHQHGHVPLIDLADALDDVSLALGLPALVPPAGKDDRDEEDLVVAKAVAAAAARSAAGAGAGAGVGMPPRDPSSSFFSKAEAAEAQHAQDARARAPAPTSAPLGLSLKKSPSLLDMINERLTSAVCGTPLAP